MSARSIVRAHARKQERNRRTTMGRRAALGAAVAIGASGAAAGTASAADYPVTNLNDSGAGSLRQALLDSNAAAGPDTISFATGLSGRIESESPLAAADAVTINGPGSDVLTVDGNDEGSVFEVGNIVAPDQAVTISGLKIVGGEDVRGGGIYNGPGPNNAAELTVTNSLLSGNFADEYGGGIYSNEGSLTVRDSSVSRNQVGDGSGNDYGGGIAVQDTDGDQATEVTLSAVTMRGNSAYGDGGAAYIISPDGAVLIERVNADGNTSQEDAGAMVLNGDDVPVTVDSSTFSDNTAGLGSGAIWVIDPGSSFTMTNSTVTGNFAAYSGGGIYVDEAGGGAPVTIANSTITGNEANERGGGVYYLANDAADVLDISSSIVAGNTASVGPDLGDNGDGVFSAGFSLIGSTAGTDSPLVSAPAGSNKVGVDPQLGPLTDNGGPTPTMLPALSSPAIDSGVANGLAVDQRGLARTVQQPTVPDAPGSDGTDIGAVELARVDTEVDGVKFKAKKTQKQKGKKVIVKVKAGAAEDVTVVAKGSVKAGKKKVALKKVTKQVAADKQATFMLKPKSKSGKSRILQLLEAGKKAKASLSLKFTDEAGNSETKKAKVTLKG